MAIDLPHNKDVTLHRCGSRANVFDITNTAAQAVSALAHDSGL